MRFQKDQSLKVWQKNISKLTKWFVKTMYFFILFRSIYLQQKFVNFEFFSQNFQGLILMKNALTTQVGMLEDMFLWLVANLKQGVIYFIKQGGGNHKIA